jgi:ABC-2 type transport system ATP-binding protein
MQAIRLLDVTKRFSGRSAIKEMSFSVEQGEIFGFLGPNGAGKTTTIRLILGLLRPDSGECLVFDKKAPDPAALLQVGVMFEDPAFYPWLSARNNLQVFAGAGPPLPSAAIEDALADAGLLAHAETKVGKYSHGMRQRLGLALALLRKPALLILDEPTNGLDPAGVREFRTLFRQLRDRGVTVFLSSHLLAEVERLCDRVAIIAKGELVALGDVPAFATEGFASHIRVIVHTDERDAALALLSRFELTIESDGTLIVHDVTGKEVNEVLARAGIYAESVESSSRLEEWFLSLTDTRRNGTE